MSTIDMENIEVEIMIEMCPEDRNPFEAIRYQFVLQEEDAKKIMLRKLNPKLFRVWRQRVLGRNTKNMALKNSIRF